MDGKMIPIIILTIVVVIQAVTIHKLRKAITAGYLSLLEGKRVMEKAIEVFKQQATEKIETEKKAADQA
jgi:hypothetical protein